MCVNQTDTARKVFVIDLASKNAAHLCCQKWANWGKIIIEFHFCWSRGFTNKNIITSTIGKGMGIFHAYRHFTIVCVQRKRPRTGKIFVQVVYTDRWTQPSSQPGIPIADGKKKSKSIFCNRYKFVMIDKSKAL